MAWADMVLDGARRTGLQVDLRLTLVFPRENCVCCGPVRLDRPVMQTQMLLEVDLVDDAEADQGREGERDADGEEVDVDRQSVAGVRAGARAGVRRSFCV